MEDVILACGLDKSIQHVADVETFIFQPRLPIVLREQLQPHRELHHRDAFTRGIERVTIELALGWSPFLSALRDIVANGKCRSPELIPQRILHSLREVLCLSIDSLCKSQRFLV